MKNRTELKLAVLIDADNIPYSNIKGMLYEIAKFGTPTIKRIYGDWTKETVSGWKPALLQNAITPIQQYSYTIGKNATDSAMIIDAMDILHREKVDGFCIVSSDSDFTRLATRLRESGMFVIGIGEKKTPQPFIVSCDKFIYIEIISSNNDDTSKRTIVNNPHDAREKIDNDIIKLLNASIDDLADEDGWASLADVGNLIIKKKTDFDPRNYGFIKLTRLIESLKEEFLIKEHKTGNKGVKHVFVRNK